MSSRAHLVAAIAIAAACGSCKIANVSFTGIGGDGDGGTSDAAGDAQAIDAKAIDAGDDTHNICNPVAQTGCNPGDKCTWVIDAVGSGGMPDTGHVGCAANGTIGLGSACSGGTGGLGADNCLGGTTCLHSVCETLCATTGSHTCGSDGVNNCQEYVDYYASGPNTVAGVCEPACDPLAQKVGAFGKTTGASPSCPTVGGVAEACYGVPDKTGAFSCAMAGSASQTDGVVASTADGGPFLNTCAPGNIGVYSFTVAGANVVYCQGYCLPSDTFAGTLGNQSGTSPYTCLRAGVNGNNSDSCIYSWSLGYPTGNFDPTVDTVASLEPWSGSASGTGLGVCFNLPAYEHFDPTNVENGTSLTQSVPSCNQVGINATVATASCTPANPCNTAAKAAQIFGAVELGCVSFETAQAHPETLSSIHKRAPLGNLRFASTATLRPQ